MWLPLFGALAVAFACLMLVQRTLYGSAICLLLVLLQVAAIFFLLGAQMLGLLQILIYAGAVMVLVVIALMASPPRLSRLWADTHVSPWLAAAVIGLLAAEGLALGLAAPTAPVCAPMVGGGELEKAMAVLLFGRWALFLEAIGALVLVASLSVVPRAEA